MMIDTHCHLDIKDYPDIKDVIKKMKSNIIVVSGVNVETIKQVINLCDEYKNVYGTIGFHPEEADNITEKELTWLETLLANPKIIGIGEIGLDYHFVSDNKKSQKNLFIQQIKLANKYKKTIVIHSRDAIEETYELLKQEKADEIKVILHCYSSSYEMAKKFIPLNVIFGIGGVLTFKNSERLKNVVKKLPIKYFVLETDSPFLTPEPYRGTRNEPYNILYVAQKISEIKNIPLEDVLNETTKNAIIQFDLNADL